MLFDLSGANGVERIVSFIGVGLLMLIIGYVAPVPPNRNLPSEKTALPAARRMSLAAGHARRSHAVCLCRLPLLPLPVGKRLTLPADVYRLAAYADLRDLRVLDAQDAARSRLRSCPSRRRPVAQLPLPCMLPAEPATSSNGSRLQLQADASGSIRLELATRLSRASPQPVRGYLLDRGPEPRQPLTALQFDWHSAGRQSCC